MNLFDVHLIFVRGNFAGCFAAREKEEEKEEEEENVEDFKIRLLNKRSSRSVKNFTDLFFHSMSSYNYTLES
jgi:hypothetical protein